MGKLKKVGIIAAGVFGAFWVMVALGGMVDPATAVNGSGVVGASVDDKYAGLTDKEVMYVKIAKESCDNKASMVSAQSETYGELVAQKCQAQEQKMIDSFRTN